MPRLSFRRIIRRPITLLPLLINIAVLLPQPVRAEQYTTNGANDFYFTIETQQQFTVRAYAQQYGIDSMLWLYDSANQQLAANDDYYGLDSYISISLPAGTYRLRTGVCCGDPNRWYGQWYQIDTNFAVVGGVSITTTTVPPTTTTTTLPQNTNWSMVNEGNQFELLAPEGFIFSEILFASYGTPTGSYGQWQLGNCHAQNSRQIIEEAALGQSFFSISATNSVFGDPCGGTPKRLAVTALYAPGSTTTSSTTTAAPPTTETTLPPTTVPETTTSTVSLPTTTEPEPTTTTSEPIQTSTTQPDVPETVAPTTSLVAETTTTQAPETTLPPTTTTSSTSTSTTVKVPTVTTSSVVTTTSQPVVVATTTTTTSGPAPRSEQVGSTTVPPTTVPFIPPAVVVELPPAEVLLELPPEQLQEVFENIDIESLTPEQQEVLIEQLTDAPDEVKATFEATVNVFSGGFDTYVPTGSTIDVGTRRVIVAASSVLSVLPVPSSAPPSAPTSGPSGGAPSDGGGTTSEEKPRRSRRGRI